MKYSDKGNSRASIYSNSVQGTVCDGTEITATRARSRRSHWSTIKNSHECVLLPSAFAFAIYPIQYSLSRNSPAQRQDRFSHINKYLTQSPTGKPKGPCPCDFSSAVSMISLEHGIWTNKGEPVLQDRRTQETGGCVCVHKLLNLFPNSPGHIYNMFRTRLW